jgi:DNA-binding XRE family transcriptional regulator
MPEGTSGTFSVTKTEHHLAITVIHPPASKTQDAGTPMLTMTFSFGHWLKQQRRSLDLTQDQLAEQIGCSSDLIRKIEAGRRRPSRSIAARLAHSLEVAPENR